ncbi:MAG: SDR family NAD(P)-dependent oxidoreductase [Gammaproteobacteria bacterium]
MSLENSLLAGKVAIVAGGGRGIGAETSRTLAAAGAAVAVADIDADRANATSAQIRAAGGRAAAVVADLLDPTQAAHIVERTVAQFGGVDTLVNVAGGAYAYVKFRRMLDWTDEEFDLMQARNLRYVFMTCRATIAHMVGQGRGGSIVNVASISGVVSAPNHAAYGAAKGGLIQLTRSIAAEYGAHGIRCNAVAPGAIATPATEGSRAPDPDAYRKAVPLGRIGQPQDVARAILFFASDLSAYVTGQTLLVDGGATVNYPLALPGSPTSL